MPLHLEISYPEKEGNLQVSKSRKLPVLLDAKEMEELFYELGSVVICDGSRPVEKQKIEISKEEFLEKYLEYVRGIQEEKLVDEKKLLPFFSAMISTKADSFYAIQLKNGKFLVKARCPVIQMQRHHFIFSDSFHSGVIGEESITWGIQFSYPQLFLDPKTKQIGKVEKNGDFPNSSLFHTLAKWIRNHTRATPFFYQEKQINQPIRIGKACFPWVNNHPMLKKRNLYVRDPKNSSETHCF